MPEDRPKILAILPAALAQPTTLKSLAEHDAIAGIDAALTPPSLARSAWERLGAMGREVALFASIDFPVQALNAVPPKLLILAADHMLLSEEELAQRLSEIKGCQVALEVTRPEEAARARRLGVRNVVAKGREAAGLVGKEKLTTLLRALKEDNQLVVFARGAVGPENAAALCTLGADGLVLDAALLLAKEITLPGSLRERLENLAASELRTLGEALGLPLRVYGGITARAPRLAEAKPGQEARRWLEDISSRSLAWQSGDPSADLWQLGEDALLARQAACYGDLAGILRATREALGASASPRGTQDSTSAIRSTSGTAPRSHRTSSEEEPIAIVGLGACLPGGANVPEFWRFVVERGDAITDVPPGRWDPSLYYDPDPRVPDRTYTRIGGWIREFAFDRRAYRIPPSVVPHLDPVQRMALVAAEEALKDANLLEGDWDRSRCAVILGNSLGGEYVDHHARRLYFPEVLEALKVSEPFARLPESTRREILKTFEERAKEKLLPITEDSMPGELANVIPGRVANVFDLGGPNFTCDAACASSAAALDTAVRGLRSRAFDVALSGGVDRQMGVGTFIKFCKIGALSADGSFPFDARANGFVMGEGAALFVLKRLSDAKRDGDRIYALLLGAGGSSDGRGKGITAPNPQGQLRALKRAYETTGVDPRSIDLIEAHGTSTKVGDAVEVRVLSEFFGSLNERGRPLALGSVKSQIGHLKSAAAAASVLKVVLGLHHKTLPPQIHFETPNPAIELEKTCLRVQTAPEPWEGRGPRRAGVSAFGFGGVNFHLVLEEYDTTSSQPGDFQPKTSAQTPTREERTPEINSVRQGSVQEPGMTSGKEIKSAASQRTGGVMLLGADDRPGLLRRMQEALSRPGDPGDGPQAAEAPCRFALSYENEDERRELLEKSLSALTAGRSLSLLENRGAFFREGKREGKLAFLFPGQGSQHLWMAENIKDQYEVFKDTWREADALSQEVLGYPLSSRVFVPKNLSEEEKGRAFKALSHTDVAQPAIFTTDLAYWRLLLAHGIVPDAVLGHSLGEYAAAVAAGVGSFSIGFRAVCARGREMATLTLEDPGKMAGISAPFALVEEVLKRVDGYVVAANKNCPSQTVIAGESKAVEEALRVFAEHGVAGVLLPVSHAFHSAIVAPASEPLRRVLAGLPLSPPKIPILSNVTAKYYPTGPSPEAALGKIRELLARQVASPVEFTACVERLYEDGVRLFVEVGPKRALSSFVASILGERPHRAYVTNDPKRGDGASFRRALAALAAEGFGGAAASPSSDVLANALKGLYTPEGSASGEHAVPEVSLTPVVSVAPTRKAEPAKTGQLRRQSDIIPAVSGIAIGLPGREKVFAEDNFDKILAGENFISPISQTLKERIVAKKIVRVVKDAQRGGGDFQEVVSPDEVIQLAGRAGALDIAREYGVEASFVEALDRTSQLALAAGLEALRDAGIPLARTFRTTRGGARIGAGWRLPESLADETGVIFASAFPGYNQLIDHLKRDSEEQKRRALIASYRELEAEIKDPVALAQISQKRRALEEAPSTPFNRRFLFEVLSMGHAQFAQWIGARGPNTQVNAACASTTQAISLAEDWLRLGRCRRVLVLGADDVTSDDLFEWIGAGFLAAGAATTEADVTRAALPFDRRRHGMIIGMGAVALVVEDPRLVAARGMVPIAEILATRIANSAFHGSRLDPEHIAREVDHLIEEAERRHNLKRAEIARNCVFMSHETYTPARGGSAAAEIAALRRAFGDGASQVVIANTKGFTGHPMGAGIEDAVVLKALQRRHVPPIANLREPDPELGDLTLSRGGHYDIDYALRLSAGFGSQLALTLYRRVAEDEVRIASPNSYTAWLREVTGLAHPVTRVIDGVLRVVEAKPQEIQDMPVANTATAPAPAAPAVQAKPSRDAVKEKLLGIVSEKTGYGSDELEEEFALEADLGIDTVKQAEIIAAVRDAYGLARDESFRLADYPTLGSLIDYVSQRLSGQEHAATPPTAAPAPVALNTPPQPATAIVAAPSAPAAVPASAPAAAMAQSGGPAPSRGGVSRDAVKEKLLGIVSEKTGYGPDELEEEFALEADLGIDTVKQAEIIAAVRDAYGLARDESFRLADYPTLGSLIDYVSQRLSSASTGALDAAEATPAVAPATSASASAEPVHTPPPSPASGMNGKAHHAAAPSGPSREEVKEKLLGIVSEKTGYGSDELEEEFALEADLGIDTVKQAEIIAAVRDAYGLARDESFRLADYPTLGSLIDYVSQRLSSAPTARATAAQSPAAKASQDTEILPGPGLMPPFEAKRVALVPAPLGKQEKLSPGARLILVDMGSEIAGALQKALIERGLRLEVLRLGPDGINPWDEAALKERLASLGASEASGLINLLALAPSTEERWSEDAHIRARAIFHVARAWKALCQEPRGIFLTAISTGGGLGVEAPSGPLPVAMAQAGFTKSLSREWPLMRARVVDAEESYLVAAIAAELEASEGPLAVGYRNQQRLTTALVTDPAPVSWSPIQPGDVIALTGGARGVTAEIARGLAKKGARVVLLGLTPLSPEVEHAPEKIDLNQARQEAKARLTAAGERITPARLDAEIAPLKRQVEIAQTLAAIRKEGGQALYLSADAADFSSLKSAIERARQTFGPITGAIHGAGVEESRLLEQKDGAAFDRVFCGKAKGAIALWKAIEQDRPRFFVGMASVAGYFGNPGQTDYAAANAALSGFFAHLSARRLTRALVIDWTAWDEVGMAVRGGMKTLLSSRGVDLLPPAQGVAYTLHAIEAGTAGEWLVAGKLGDFEQPAASAAPVKEAAPQAAPAQLPEGSLLDRIVSETPGEKVVAQRTLRPEEDLFLSDHAIDGTPVLPGVVGLEMLAQAASLLCPERALGEARDVSFWRPVKVHEGKTTEVLAVAERQSDGSIRTSLRSRREGAGGRILESEHFSATFWFEKAPKEAPAPLDLGEGLYDGPTREEVYRHFFHGPSFQVIGKVPALGPLGAAAAYETPEKELRGLFTDPLPRELAFQAAGLHAMANEKSVALPAGIRCVRRYAAAPKGAKLLARVAYRGRDAQGHFCYDAEIRGSDGTLFDVMEGLRLVPARELSGELLLPASAREGLEVVIVGTGPVGHMLLHAPELLVEGWLSPREREKLSSFALEKRRIEWMAGRLAAKRLLRGYLGRRFGVEISPLLLEIEPDANGAPRCRIVSNDALPLSSLPEISITHSGEIAAAALSSCGRPGVDVEKIEPRDPSFREHCFTPNEVSLVSRQMDDESATLTRFFSLKEAVSKSLGLGFALDPREIEIVDLKEDGKAEISLHGQAFSAFQRLGGTRLEASVETRGAYAYAWAKLVTPGVNGAAHPPKPSA